MLNVGENEHPMKNYSDVLKNWEIDGAVENTTAYNTDIINNDLLSSEQKTVGYISFIQIALTIMQMQSIGFCLSTNYFSISLIY